MPNDDNSPISAQEAKRLFADWRGVPAIVLAVSGGPDSIALMWLAARWRRGLKRGPRLIAVTIDHGLRPEGVREALNVKRLAEKQRHARPHRAYQGRSGRDSVDADAARQRHCRPCGDGARDRARWHAARAALAGDFKSSIGRDAAQGKN